MCYDLQVMMLWIEVYKIIVVWNNDTIVSELFAVRSATVANLTSRHRISPVNHAHRNLIRKVVWKKIYVVTLREWKIEWEKRVRESDAIEMATNFVFSNHWNIFFFSHKLFLLVFFPNCCGIEVDYSVDGFFCSTLCLCLVNFFLFIQKICLSFVFLPPSFLFEF